MCCPALLLNRTHASNLRMSRLLSKLGPTRLLFLLAVENTAHLKFDKFNKNENESELSSP